MRLLLTEGQQSDHKGAATLLPDLLAESEMLGDKGDYTFTVDQPFDSPGASLNLKSSKILPAAFTACKEITCYLY